MCGLVAKTPRQLDIALKLFYAEGIPCSVETVDKLDDKGKRKISYLVNALTADERMSDVKKRYEILIS